MNISDDHVSQIREIAEENGKLKEKYQVYKNRLNELTKKNLLPKHTKKNGELKEALTTAMQRLEGLKSECNNFSHKDFKYSPGIEAQKLALEKKLLQVKAENEMLKEKNKGKTFEEAEIEKELMASIENYRKKISILEDQHMKNSQILKSLKGKTSPELGPENSEKNMEKLWKIEQNLKSSLKSSDLKNQQRLKELENTAEKLSADKVCIQMKILKTSQQERLLQMTIDKNLGDNEHSFNDVNFLYKPSIKALYH